MGLLLFCASFFQLSSLVKFLIHDDLMLLQEVATLVAVLFATNKIFVCAFSFRFLNDSVLSLQVVSIVDGWLMQPDTCKMS